MIREKKSAADSEDSPLELDVQRAALEKPAPVASTEISDGARGYTVGTWGGRPNYVCVTCTAATLNEGTMQGHVERHRPPTPIGRITVVPR